MKKNILIKYLLRIPKVLLFDAAVFLLGLMADGFFANQHHAEELGHDGPFLTIFALMLIAVVTAVVLVKTIYQIIMLFFGPKESDGTPKKRINPLIPIGFDTVLSLILVYALGSYEINSFYNNPDHIGFAIPAGTFVLAFVLFIIWIGVVVISIHSYRKNK